MEQDLHKMDRPELLAEVAALRERVGVLEEALRFYSREDWYTWPTGVVPADKGQTARIALSTGEPEEKES